jgi:hypothetical protein
MRHKKADASGLRKLLNSFHVSQQGTDSVNRNSMAKEVHGNCSKHALFQVNDQPVLLEAGENLKEMQLMVLQ